MFARIVHLNDMHKAAILVPKNMAMLHKGAGNIREAMANLRHSGNGYTSILGNQGRRYVQRILPQVDRVVVIHAEEQLKALGETP